MSIIKQIQNRRRQLDELSKTTLGNYAYKAAHKMASARADHALAVDNKHRAKAAGKETAAKYAGQNMSRAHKEHEKRAAGFFKAVSKLAKEEVEQIDELSKDAMKSYGRKALKDVAHREKEHDKTKFGSDDHIKSGAKIDVRNHYIRKAAAKITNGASKSKLNYEKSEVGGGHKNYALTVKRAKERLQREEVEQLDETQMGEVSKKLAHHGYKKFGDTDRVDHKTNLTHFHHEEHGHLICVDHTDHGRVKSASALKCTNAHTGEMHHSWGQEHPHVEHALSELGHKSYVGLKEDEQIDEISQDLARSYLGKAIKQKHQNYRYDRGGNFDGYKDESAAGKRDNGINLAAKKLHMKEPHGVAKVAATKSKIREELEAILDEGNVLHKKGRPKKARHEDGKIVNDPDA